MTIEKYSASPGYLPTIEVIDVDRETDTHVWIDGNRRAKNSMICSYHATFEQAKAHLLGLASEDMHAAIHHAQRKQRARNHVLALTPF